MSMKSSTIGKDTESNGKPSARLLRGRTRPPRPVSERLLVGPHSLTATCARSWSLGLYPLPFLPAWLVHLGKEVAGACIRAGVPYLMEHRTAGVTLRPFAIWGLL